MQDYSQYKVRERLRDGRDIFIRAIRPSDKEALQEGLRRLSDKSSYFRFFQVKHDATPAELEYFTEIDFRDHVGLVGVLCEEDTDLVVAGARYIVCEREPVVAAELAFAVDDAHQELGIGTLLLRHLVKIARGSHVSEFTATVLATNKKMLHVFTRSGLPQRRSRTGDVIDLRLSLN